MGTDMSQRPSVDLICVIDKSGSMGGEKIKLVRDTLMCLLELLKDNDRICLIEFASSARRLCPLTSVSEKNQAKLK